MSSHLFYYRYIPYRHDKNVDIVVTKTEKPKKSFYDESRLVILGGTFEKVGKQDEVVGGGSQKVGSDNKQ